jgi:hypothetical protein
VSSYPSSHSLERAAIVANPLSEYIESASPMDTKAAFEWLRAEFGLKSEPEQKMTGITKTV